MASPEHPPEGVESDESVFTLERRLRQAQEELKLRDVMLEALQSECKNVTEQRDEAINLAEVAKDNAIEQASKVFGNKVEEFEALLGNVQERAKASESAAAEIVRRQKTELERAEARVAELEDATVRMMASDARNGDANGDANLATPATSSAEEAELDERRIAAEEREMALDAAKRELLAAAEAIAAKQDEVERRDEASTRLEKALMEMHKELSVREAALMDREVGMQIDI